MQNIWSVACNLVVFSNIALQVEEPKFYPLNIAFLVASIDRIFTVSGIFVVPSKIEIIGWLQQLKLLPVACNFVVFSNIAVLVA